MKGKAKTIGFYIAVVIIFLLMYTIALILNNRWYSFLLITVALLALLFFRNYKKIKGWKYAITWIISIIISIASIVYGRPDLGISFAGNLQNEGIKFYVRTIDKFTDKQVIINIMDDYIYEPYEISSWTPPKGYSNTEVSLSNSRGYLLINEEGNHEKVVYQLHGGAYIMPFNNKYNEAALNYSKAYDDADVFSLDYRVADQAAYPAALDDAMEGYKWLLDQGYKSENIVVAGDSAGGGLSLALTLRLRDEKLTLPKCLILASPWTDLSQEGKTYDSNRKTDAYFGSAKEEALGTKVIPIPYVGDSSVYDPYISPVYAEYNNMPPMLIQAGSTEMLLSDSETVASKASNAGVNVKFKVYNGMWHVFYIATDSIPESKEAWQEIDEFIHSLN